MRPIQRSLSNPNRSRVPYNAPYQILIAVLQISEVEQFARHLVELLHPNAGLVDRKQVAHELAEVCADPTCVNIGPLKCVNKGSDSVNERRWGSVVLSLADRESATSEDL